MRSVRVLWLMPVVALFASASLTGCAGYERIGMRVVDVGCQLRGAIPANGKCIEPQIVVEPPRFCYQTLARVDCYAEPVRFGPDPGFLRAPPPDL